jgi:hypothetical protein
MSDAGGELVYISERSKRRRGRRSVPDRPAETLPPPDRNVGLNMAATCGVDADAAVIAPDEVLDNLDVAPAAAPASAPPEPSPTGAVPPSRTPAVATADVPAELGVDGDEVLRELEEHHTRQQPPSRTSAPRGSADVPATRPLARATERTRCHDDDAQPQSRRRRAAALAAIPTVAAIAIAVTQLPHTTAAARSTAFAFHTSTPAAPLAEELHMSNLGSTVAGDVRSLASGLPARNTRRRHSPRGRRSSATRRHQALAVDQRGSASVAAAQPPTYTPTPASTSNTNESSTTTQTSPTRTTQPAGPTHSGLLGGIGSCVKGCS